MNNKNNQNDAEMKGQETPDNNIIEEIHLRGNREEFYPRINRCINNIFDLLDILKENGKYLDVVASFESKFTRDTAKYLWYEQLSKSFFREFLEKLEDTEADTAEIVSMCYKEIQSEKDREIGNSLYELTGETTLDGALKKLKEQDSQRQSEKLKSVSIGIRGIKDKGASLSELFNEAPNEVPEGTSVQDKATASTKHDDGD